MKAFPALRALLVFLSFLLLGVPVPGAELKFANVFSDHMVLQRDKPTTIWGSGTPGAMVRVTFTGQSQRTEVGDDGRWRVTMKPFLAADKPQELEVVEEGSDHKAIVRDVLVGEVWLGSGQSNMAMTVNRARDFEQEKGAANLPQIRMFKEDSGASATANADSKGVWTVASPETVGTFSATLYFFGKNLYRELQVPIGLINSSVGGTPIESWIDAEAQASVPVLRAKSDKDAKVALTPQQLQEQYERAMTRWKVQAAKAKENGQPAPRKPIDPAAQSQRRGGPGGLFNGKIAPLIPYTVRGVLWYQGEANSRPGKGSLYQHQLELLVTDWRRRWGEELPFAWVQLPNFDREGEDWLLVRESMLKALRLPATGMAVTIDIGDPRDIHPKNKQDVGARLASWAIGAVYSRKGFALGGPLPAKHAIVDGTIEITFKNHDGGLVAKGDGLTGFEISGEEGTWMAANAKIVGDKVIVSSPQVAQPTAARYAWAPNPTCNLYNGSGLPASPFRTP